MKLHFGQFEFNLTWLVFVRVKRTWSHTFLLLLFLFQITLCFCLLSRVILTRIWIFSVVTCLFPPYDESIRRILCVQCLGVVSCMPCKSDGGVNAVKVVFWQGGCWTYNRCNWFCTVTFICTNRRETYLILYRTEIVQECYCSIGTF